MINVENYRGKLNGLALANMIMQSGKNGIVASKKIKEINTFDDFKSYANETGIAYMKNIFFPELFNQIGRIVIGSSDFHDPLTLFDKGVLEKADDVQELFVNLVEAEPFERYPNVEDAYKMYFPDIKETIHNRNVERIYKMTFNDMEVERALSNRDEFESLYGRVMNAVIVSKSVDDYNLKKMCIAEGVAKGMAYMIPLKKATTKDDIIENSIRIQNAIDDARFSFGKYIPSGVDNVCDPAKGYIIMSNDYKNQVDFKLLASQFHLDKSEIKARTIVIDDFGNINQKRLKSIFDYVGTGLNTKLKPLDNEVLKLMNKIKCIYVDEKTFNKWNEPSISDSFRQPFTTNVTTGIAFFDNMYISPFNTFIAFYEEDTDVLVADANIEFKVINKSKDSEGVTFIECKKKTNSYQSNRFKLNRDNEKEISFADNGTVYVYANDKNLTAVKLTATTIEDRVYEATVNFKTLAEEGTITFTKKG